MKTTHTPGPWTISDRTRKKNEYGAIMIDIDAISGPLSICSVYVLTDMSGGIEEEHTAHLISAAPDLLEMLEEAKLQIEYLHGKFGETGTGNSVLSRIDSVIQKATK